MNKEEIRVVVDKVISIIKAMGDGESSSINEIINDNNMETKDKIIVKNYVTEELKRDDICLDYGSSNEGLDDKFKKMNIMLNEFKEIINTIKNGNYKHSEDNYTVGIFDKRYLNYADIIIDNEEYEILLTDNLLGRLMGVIKMNEVSNTSYAAYMY